MTTREITNGRAKLACVGAAVLVLVAPVSIALAQQDLSAGIGPGAGMGPGSGMRMTRVDTNGDGVISADEAAAWHEEAFAAMDSDGDEVVTKDEYLATHLSPGGGTGPRAKMMQQRKEAHFAEIDKDKNGKLSLDEFLSGGETHFAAADRDGDGKVSVWEFRTARRW